MIEHNKFDILISIIWGFGIAALFHKTCAKEKYVIVENKNSNVKKCINCV